MADAVAAWEQYYQQLSAYNAALAAQPTTAATVAYAQPAVAMSQMMPDRAYAATAQPYAYGTTVAGSGVTATYGAAATTTSVSGSKRAGPEPAYYGAARTGGGGATNKRAHV